MEVSPRGTRFLLFGQEDVIEKHASAFENFDSGQVEIRHAPEVVGMDEKPIAGIKGKKNSSMALALKSVKEQEAQALLSCGNTGCLMAGSTIRLRTLEGVERPALCTIWPGRRKIFYAFGCGCESPCQALSYSPKCNTWFQLREGCVRACKAKGWSVDHRYRRG